MSAVPPIVFGPTGPVAPTEPQILAGVQSDINGAFGGNLNPALDTPQGQLASTETAVIGEVISQFLAIVAGVDPAFSSGRFQDAIGRIYFQTRIPAASTVVACDCVGLTGTFIPQGSIAIAADGNLYYSLQDATIPLSGTISISFACAATGPIACPAGALVTIYKSVTGWDSISNAADGAIGRDAETRSQFETRRAASVAINALGILPAVQGKVLAVAGVLDAYCTENKEDTSQTIGGVSLVPHSLYVAVNGGTESDIIAAIWSKKSLGCNYNGNTSGTIQDTSPGYSPPYPTYTVKYEVPTGLPIYFALTLGMGTDVPANALQLVQTAIAQSFAGLDNGAPARIGAEIFASRYYGNIAAIGPWVRIISLFIGTGASPSGNIITVNIDQLPTITASHITLTLA